MKKTIEQTWQEGFLDPRALVAPRVNDFYARKSTHIVERIQRMQRINEIAILIAAPVLWLVLAALGMPYAGAIACAGWVGLIAVRRRMAHITKFQAPASADSYQFLKAFQDWLKNRLAWGRRVQRHLYPLTFIAMAIGLWESAFGQELLRALVESYPGLTLVHGVPVVAVAVVVAIAVVLELLGGIIFDIDVSTVYRGVIRKVEEMVGEMEELRA